LDQTRGDSVSEARPNSIWGGKSRADITAISEES